MQQSGLLPLPRHVVLAVGSSTLLLRGLGGQLALRGFLVALSRLHFSLMTRFSLSSGPRDLPKPNSLCRELQSAYVGLAVRERRGPHRSLLLGGSGYREQSKTLSQAVTPRCNDAGTGITGRFSGSQGLSVVSQEPRGGLILPFLCPLCHVATWPHAYLYACCGTHLGLVLRLQGVG